MTAKPRLFRYPGFTGCGRAFMEQSLAWAYSAGKNNESVRYRADDYSPKEIADLRSAFGSGLANIDEPTARIVFDPVRPGAGHRHLFGAVYQGAAYGSKGTLRSCRCGGTQIWQDGNWVPSVSEISARGDA